MLECELAVMFTQSSFEKLWLLNILRCIEITLYSFIPEISTSQPKDQVFELFRSELFTKVKYLLAPT